jgi:hypothetical protein
LIDPPIAFHKNMLISFYKSSRAGAVFTIPILAIVLWTGTFIYPHPIVPQPVMPLYELVLNLLPSYQWFRIFIGFSLVLTGTLMVNYLVDHFEVLSQRNNLPALFYMVLMSCSGSLQTLHPALFANLFMIMALFRLITSYRKETAFSEMFDMGFLLSLATLFYLPSLAFIPMVFISLVIMRPFVWREWVILTIGILLPFLFISTWYFCYDELDLLWRDEILEPLMHKDYTFHISSGYVFLCSVVGLITGLSIGKLLLAEAPIKLRSKKVIQLLFCFLLFSAFSLFFATSFDITHFSFFAIPLSIMFSHYFLRLKRPVIGEVLFTLLVLSIILGFILS